MMKNDCCEDKKTLEFIMNESLNLKKNFFEEIIKRAEELKDLLVNYIEIYNVENENYASDIKKIIDVL